jgi:hypothetical protein
LLSTHDTHCEVALFALARQLVEALEPLLLEHANAASAATTVAPAINIAFIIADDLPEKTQVGPCSLHEAPAPLDGVRGRPTH